jgi:HEPN domain-containing protein
LKRSEWANQWLQKAEEDFKVALLMRREGFFQTCAFHCQQAVEKAVKALWIDVKQIDPPRIHTVGPLAIQLGADSETVADINDVVGDYMASRYPDAAASLPMDYYTDTDADQRLAKVEEVLSWVRSQWENDDES